MIFPDKVYNILKWVVMIAIPAVTALWLGLGKIWGFPYLVEIGATLGVIDTFIGALIGISTLQYNKLDNSK